MNISRMFLIIGALYLIVGMTFGIYMGGAQDFTFAPLHAHINLVGFTLMTLFGIVYRVIPGLADTMLATLHFWMFQIGALLLVVMLYLLLSGSAPEATLGPILGIVEVGVLLSVVAFLLNLYRKA